MILAMPLRRLGVSNYFFISKREMHPVVDEEASRRFLLHLEDDPAAMGELRALLAESNLDIRRQPPLTDDEVKSWIARLLNSGALLVAREWPAHGGAATPSSQAQAPAETASKAMRAVKTWIEIELLDDSGQPVPGEAYQIELPDGRVVRGRLDSEGKARFRNIDPGTCQVSFPEIDAAEWDAA
jgi:hypothetical protein